MPPELAVLPKVFDDVSNIPTARNTLPAHLDALLPFRLLQVKRREPRRVRIKMGVRLSYGILHQFEVLWVRPFELGRESKRLLANLRVIFRRLYFKRALDIVARNSLNVGALVAVRGGQSIYDIA